MNNNTNNNNIVKYIIIATVVLVLFLTIDSYMNGNTYNVQTYEHYGASDLDVKDLELLDHTSDDLHAPHTHHHVINYLSNKEFIAMIEHIKSIVVSGLVDRARTCQRMNGDEVKVGDGKTTLSLVCQTDPWRIEEEIVLNITKFVREHIKQKFNIDLNPYHIIHDLMRHLNLLEAVIYPLQCSGLYTVHGVQYITRNYIENKVGENLDIKDVLLTTLSRRNISLLVDTDQHIQ